MNQRIKGLMLISVFHLTNCSSGDFVGHSKDKQKNDNLEVKQQEEQDNPQAEDGKENLKDKFALAKQFLCNQQKDKIDQITKDPNFPWDTVGSTDPENLPQKPKTPDTSPSGQGPTKGIMIDPNLFDKLAAALKQGDQAEIEKAIKKLLDSIFAQVKQTPLPNKEIVVPKETPKIPTSKGSICDSTSPVPQTPDSGGIIDDLPEGSFRLKVSCTKCMVIETEFAVPNGSGVRESVGYSVSPAVCTQLTTALGGINGRPLTGTTVEAVTGGPNIGASCDDNGNLILSLMGVAGPWTWGPYNNSGCVKIRNTINGLKL